MKFCIFLAATFCIFSFTGCKKDDSGNKPDCRIIKITEPLSNTEVFSYDAKGRILTVDYGSWATSFRYVGDSIIKEGTWKSVYALNSNGLLAFERREYNNSGTQWEKRTYEYDGTKLKRSTVNKYSGNNIRTYTWSNGNMITEQIQGADYSQSTSYEYDTGKPYSPGDYFSWDLLENGVETIRNKNLVKKRTSIYIDNNPGSSTPGVPETEISNYNYAFDSNGKIISMTVTDQNNSNPSTYTYEYHCN
ncbi:hypothetical protein [Niabella aurantiaca]|uniref:hypothetical protein n=1 Tax=Niabella aurantiaca TaxID=379900 RepID=UPI00037E84F4|nr:hypothetical protein [Niabella aurantiaca]